MTRADTPHDPAPLRVVASYTKQGGRSPGGRRWAVHWRCLKCHTCGREFNRMTNPLRGRLVRCVGSDRLSVTAKPKNFS